MQWRKKYENVKNFLLEFWSKEFLVFLFFLAITTVLWFASSLNDTYEKDIMVALKLDDVPANIVVTDELPEVIKVTVRDKGFNLLRYSMKSEEQVLHLPFYKYAGKTGRGNVTLADVHKMLRAQLLESTKVISVKGDHWDFYYIKGISRRLPILLGGQVKAKSDYYIMSTSLAPDSVDVYATPEAFDTLTAIYTEPFVFDGLATSVNHRLALKHVFGAKFTSVTSTTLTAVVDQLTEVAFNVPIKTVNVPGNVQIKTFPARVDIRVSVGRKTAHLVKPEQFNVVVDYNELPKDDTSRFPLHIITQPKNIVKAFLKLTEVDYIIEHL